MSTPIRMPRNGKENCSRINQKGTPRKVTMEKLPNTPQSVNSKSSNGSIELKSVRPNEPKRTRERTTPMPSINEILKNYKPAPLGSTQKQYSIGECEHVVKVLWKRIHQLEVELINTQEDCFQYQKEYIDIKEKGSQLYDVYISNQNTLTDLKSK